ncbi:MAG: PDZ domain-containing protein [Planctomycetota bacterium]
MAELRYGVSIPSPATQRLTVELAAADLPAGDALLSMPRWAPGWYVLREYSRNVETIRARTPAGREVAVEKDGVSTWRIRKGRGKSVVVTLTIHAPKWGDAYSFVDAHHASLFGPSVFPWIHGTKHEPATLAIDAPEAWKRISTGLEPVNGDPRLREAEDYDHLIDSPIEIGNHEVRRFEAGGKPHELAIVGGPIATDPAKVVADLAKIVEEEGRMFGELPYDRYVFLLYVTPEPTGSLEHRNSTTLTMLPACFESPERYVNKFLATSAHEFFHLYNVKRIRPADLVPFDYLNEQHTKLMWIFEGLTSYFDDRIVMRAGLTEREDYLRKIANNVTTLRTTPGRRLENLHDASFDSWTKFMSKDANWGNRGISFYTKGLLVGMCADLLIRKRSKGRGSLDDAMRTVFRDTKRKNYAGLTERRFRSACEAAAGAKLPEIFDGMLDTTMEIDFDEYLGLAGYRLAPDRPKRGRLEPKATQEGFVGAEWETREGRVFVAKVPVDTPAHLCGLLAGDEVVFVNDRRVASAAELADRIRWAAPGDALRFLVARHGRPTEVAIVATKAPVAAWKVAKKRSRSLAERKLGEKWLEVS